mgnify:CR=1 FL=1
MNRREFLSAIVPLAASARGEEPSNYSIPARWIERYKLQPVSEGVTASRIVVRGEDRRLYRLSDILRVLFMHHKA